MSFETPNLGPSEERVRPIAAKFVGDGGYVIYFSNGTESWVDARGRAQWEDQTNVPPEERLVNLPPPKEEGA